jgi:hypothetical protein
MMSIEVSHSQVRLRVRPGMKRTRDTATGTKIAARRAMRLAVCQYAALWREVYVRISRECIFVGLEPLEVVVAHCPDLEADYACNVERRPGVDEWQRTIPRICIAIPSRVVTAAMTT